MAVLFLIQIASAWSATVSGTVKIEGKKDKSGVLVTIHNIQSLQGRSLSGVTDADGKYSIQNVPSGSYTISAQKPGNISVVRSDIVVNADITVDFQLIPGDLKIDNQINLLDRVVLSSVWKSKKGDVNWNSMMDIYEDNVIDEKDRDLLLASWRKGNPNVKLGSLTIDSTPSGADILINGANSGLKTPYTFPGLIIGEYLFTLQMKNYAPVEVKAQIKEGQIQLVPSVVLDNQPPTYTDWATDPADIKESTIGRLQVTVKVTDVGGSGLGDKIPQFDYSIGTNSKYNGYKPMKSLGNNLWSFDIPEPSDTWNTYRSKNVYYKVKAEDAVGNVGESTEQQKLIANINHPPVVKIINTFGTWQKGLITITAEASSDPDGTITGVQFEYSLDNINWTQIGTTVDKSPYSVSWDTKTIIRDVTKNVWLRATAIDNLNTSTKYLVPTSFGIDNQAPVTSHDYNGLWNNKDFTIILKATDGNGIGVATISYKLNNGNKQDIEVDGQSSAPLVPPSNGRTDVAITKEDQANTIEYWSTDKLGNEEQHKTLSDIKLDKTPPAFTDWRQDPVDLTQDTKGRLRIYVRVADDGSGLTGKLPQIDYHIGTDTQYSGYKSMVSDDGKLWYFDIPEPNSTWDAYPNKYVYYKVKCEDVAGNIGESPERSELLDYINKPPIVKIVNTYDPWQKGVLKIEATASDLDGTVTNVQFEYSFDKSNWKPIGAPVTAAPYSIGWDTVAAIQQAPVVWLRVTATDNARLSTTYVYPTSIGIDNQPPITSDDYNDLWHKEDFVITLTALDGNGIGISPKNITYKLNNGDENNVQANGQPKIITEGIHQLEYWSIDDIGNTEIHHTIQNIKLDKTSPVFTDWTKDPMDLIEDSVGSFRVSVRVTDIGSGLTGKIPQIGYHIGKDTVYGEYVNMLKGEAKDVWYYDIPEPSESWTTYSNKTIDYKARMEDVAGNLAESPEQSELIDFINKPPTVKITTTFNTWEKGQLKIDADASDHDGVIAKIDFDYSSNKVEWTPIGTVASAPYTVMWDTKTAIPQVSLSVWVRVTATDDGGLSKEFVIPNSFKIDNEIPTTSQDYDGTWKNKNFIITLTATDKNGIGVASILYKLNNADKQTVPINGQAGVPVSMTDEGANTLEYWSVDGLGNEEPHKILSNINLDKTLPKFSNWEQIPADLTEDTVGKFRVSVQITDSGSGLSGKIAQFDYHIGNETKYEGFKNMTTDDSTTWYYDIPEPTGKWDSFRGQYVFYKVKIEDVAKNSSESLERKEPIDSINDPPVVSLTSTFKDWETKEIELKADASDADDSKPIVQFEFSIDNVNWKTIGTPDETSPYSILWDTRLDIPELAKSVWVRALAIDSDDKTVLVPPSDGRTESVKSEPSRKFGVDNQSPVAGNWTKSPENLTEDTAGTFRVTVDYNDGEGSGVNKVEITYKIGNSSYRDFREMRRESSTSNTWYYEIGEIGGWDQYLGQTLSYKARSTDVVSNVSPETKEQQELIDDINDPPTGLITSSYKDWERGIISIQATASDQDGDITTVQFQYSTDNLKWIDIGAPLTRANYSVTWDTTVIELDPEIWLKAIVTDDDKASTDVLISKTLGIDNKVPELANWKLTPANLTESSTDSFLRVAVEITDQGSGVDDTKVLLNYRIASGTYVGYQTMYKQSGTWFYEYEIPRPLGGWSSYAGQIVYYKVKANDVAGNVVESKERSEPIEPTTGVISGTITPRESWRVAKVIVLKNDLYVAEGAVSSIDGSYSVTNLNPGTYNLQITALGYGTDKSKLNVEIKVGQLTTVPNVELYTYAVETIPRSQGGKVEFKDAEAKNYSMIVDSNTFLQDTKVVLGFSGIEPTSIPNPTVILLGKAIGVGFEGKSISKPLKLIIPRPSGITDANSIMLFIYNGSDYKMIDRDNIATSDSTITAVIPPDVRNFSDANHKFDKSLSKTADTAFYVLVTKFYEPQIITTDLGIRDPQLPSGKVSGYLQPIITSANKKIALVIHGITSKPDDMANIITDLRSLKLTGGTTPYYDQVLVFNFKSGTESIAFNSSFLATELARVFPAGFSGTIDVVAHDTGALVVRHSIINSGLDRYIGSLIMLAVPNNGINVDLLRAGFSSFIKKTQSDPIWTYYCDGWQEILNIPENTQFPGFLGTLNNQPGKKVNTHYFAMSASDPTAPSDADNNDGLVYLSSVDFTNKINFPFFEQALPGPDKPHEKMDVTPFPEGRGFMSQTRHLAILSSPSVRDNITNYLRGKSENIKIDRTDIDLIPGNRVEKFNVVLKNVGTDTVYGVTAKLSTQDPYIRKYSGAQGIEKDTASYGDIAKDQSVSNLFSFEVSSSASTAPIGYLVPFTLVIGNSKDNSISIREFTASIGKIIQIDLNTILADTNKDTDRPQNDGDPAREPGEIMKINITLKNISSSSMQSIVAVLKTDDLRLKGLVNGNEVDMAKNGITVDYGSFLGSGSVTKDFKYIKLSDDQTLQGDINFTLDIKSGQTVIGRDTFTVKIGADIIVDKVEPDSQLIPGEEDPQDIDVLIKNITSKDINDVEVRIKSDKNEVNITDDRIQVGQLRASSSDTVKFEATIDDGFAGYVTFTLEISVNNQLINTETSKQYFGMRTHYIADWITSDGNSNKIAEPGEAIKLQIARRNPTYEIAQDVSAELTLTTADPSLTSFSKTNGSYNDIPADSVAELSSEYRFTVVPDVTATASTNLTATRLEMTTANWIPGAFAGRLLNPNTHSSDPQYWFHIVNNGDKWIDVDVRVDNNAAANMLDPGIATDPQPGDPFKVRIGPAGHAVSFTLNVEENGEPIGEEIDYNTGDAIRYNTRIGGAIRYLPPTGYSGLMATINDSKTISSTNNANGIPEPGEKIEITVTLINTTNSTYIGSSTIGNVIATLDTDENDVRIDSAYDEFKYGSMSNSSKKQGKYRFTIDKGIEVNKILFNLNIEGEIDGDNTDLGTDTFVIPVKRQL
jgi:hypothetical protein